jgi:hypothetical protein
VATRARRDQGKSSQAHGKTRCEPIKAGCAWRVDSCQGGMWHACMHHMQIGARRANPGKATCRGHIWRAECTLKESMLTNPGAGVSRMHAR